MGKTTGIAWTDHTFNPWIGCDKVAFKNQEGKMVLDEACRHCYAEGYDARYFEGKHWGKKAARKTMSAHYWNDPLRWERDAAAAGQKRKVFCASLADIFDPAAPEGARERVFEITKKTPNLIWLFLSKRLEHAMEFLPKDWAEGYPNCWIGATTATQASADLRIPQLQQIPAKLKFLSIEPQVENVNFTQWLSMGIVPFHWMIFGGESGSSRIFDPEWVRLPLTQARRANIPVFVKQMGSAWARVIGCKSPKAADPAEWPEWIRVREFPKL